nr:glycosyltransferase [Sphingomonas sp. Y57]
MKRITHIITGLHVGGAERALHSLLTGGLQDRFDNRVISLMGEGAYGPRLREAGIEVRCLGMSPGRPSPIGMGRLLRAVGAQVPDIVQGWMYHGNLAASFARRLVAQRAALSWNIRTSLDNLGNAKRSTRLLIRLGRPLSRGVSTILYNSQKSRLQHEADGYAAANGIFIPNGFDIEHWRRDPSGKPSLARTLGLTADTKIIGFVGRAYAAKDLPNLFAAFQQVASAHSECHLVCVGRQIEETAPPSLDRSRVTFLGQRSDIAQIMPGFDLFCLSSSTEGFPNVIGEAMACGVPCITTDVGDAAVVVGDTGWVVPARDPDALAQAISEALSLADVIKEQLGAAARLRIETHYALPAIVDQYAALYQNLSGGNGSVSTEASLVSLEK